MPPSPSALHSLSIVLSPDDASLTGVDTIRMQPPPDGPATLLLSSTAGIERLDVNGRTHAYHRDRGLLILPANPVAGISEMVLSIRYRCRFDDPVPIRPVNTDNPGFGVTGTISDRGIFLLSGAGWYPQVAGRHERYDLRVDGPRNIVAVTSGRLAGITHNGNRTLSN